MATSPADKTATPTRPKGLINGRKLAPCLLPTFSMGRMAPLLRLHLDYYFGPEGSPLTVKILELDGYFTPDGKGGKTRIQEKGADAVLATFRVTPQSSPSLQGLAGWTNAEPVESGLTKRPERPVPYFRLTFAALNHPKSPGVQEEDAGAAVFCIPLDKAGEEEDGFEIGYEIADSDGFVLSRTDCNVAKLKIPSCRIPSALEDAFLCGDFAHGNAMEGWLNDRYAEDGQDAVRTPSLLQLDAENREKVKAAADRAMKDLDHYLKSSESAYAAHVRNFRAYQEALRAYLDLLSIQGRTPLEDRHMLDGRLWLRKQEVDRRKKDLDEYLSQPGVIPVNYQEQIEEIRKARKRSEALDAFLDHPITKVITFLPGMNVLPSVVKIAQGKYVEGFVSAGLDLMSAGAFGKLSRMARLFKESGSKSAGSLTALLSYRYLQAALGKKGKLDTLLQITSRVDPGYGALFETFKGFKSLVGQGEKVANLLKANAAVRGVRDLVVQANAKSAKELFKIVKSSDHYPDFLLAVEFLQLGKKTKSAQEKAQTLADLLKGPQAKEPDGLAEAIRELKALSVHHNVLPSAKFAEEATELVISLLQGFTDLKIPLEDFLNEIPIGDVTNQNALEITRTRSQQSHEVPTEARLNATRMELKEQLKFIADAYRDVVPLRAKEHLVKGMDGFQYWDKKQCNWSLDLEARVDKFADQLEARAMLMGLDYNIRTWIQGVTVQDPYRKGKRWIVHPGYSSLGVGYCESLIEWISE